MHFSVSNFSRVDAQPLPLFDQATRADQSEYVNIRRHYSSPFIQTLDKQLLDKISDKYQLHVLIYFFFFYSWSQVVRI